METIISRNADNPLDCQLPISAAGTVPEKKVVKAPKMLSD